MVGVTVGITGMPVLDEDTEDESLLTRSVGASEPVPALLAVLDRVVGEEKSVAEVSEELSILVAEVELTESVGVPEVLSIVVCVVEIALFDESNVALEVSEAVGVVVGALLNEEEDSTLVLLDDDALLLDELSEEPTELLLLSMEDVAKEPLEVVSPIDVDEDLRVVSVGWTKVLDPVLYTVDSELLD